MKYRLLSKEQFEELHEEFSRFLAAQQITKSDWDVLKTSKSEQVQVQLENFSDLVWDEVLDKTTYLEHFSKDSINLFYCEDKQITRIVVRVENNKIDLKTKEGFDWFIDNSKDAPIHYFKGQKGYLPTRSDELFQLIETGAVLADGKFYGAVSEMIMS